MNKYEYLLSIHHPQLNLFPYMSLLPPPPLMPAELCKKQEIVKLEQNQNMAAQKTESSLMVPEKSHLDNKNTYSKSRDKKPNFHNFQKHLATTIRTIINPKLFPKYQSQELTACQEFLWHRFCSSSKQNKTLIEILLSDLEKIPENLLQTYGFQQILAVYEPTTVKLVQEQLKKNIVEQLNSCDLNEVIVNRRIKRKEQFCVYFHVLRRELGEGDLSKRVTGLTKAFSKNKCNKKVKVQESI